MHEFVLDDGLYAFLYTHGPWWWLGPLEEGQGLGRGRGWGLSGNHRHGHGHAHGILGTPRVQGGAPARRRRVRRRWVSLSIRRVGVESDSLPPLTPSLRAHLRRHAQVECLYMAHSQAGLMLGGSCSGEGGLTASSKAAASQVHGSQLACRLSNRRGVHVQVKFFGYRHED